MEVTRIAKKPGAYQDLINTQDIYRANGRIQSTSEDGASSYLRMAVTKSCSFFFKKKIVKIKKKLGSGVAAPRER